MKNNNGTAPFYTSGSEAVSHLHQNGFTNDFQMAGNDLLWVQEKIFIRLGEFSILEYYTVAELAVFGLSAPSYNIKGILVNRTDDDGPVTPPVLVKKLNEMNALQ